MDRLRESCRTKAEKRLAEALQAKKWSFKQNQSLDGYEVDFWFPNYRLAIEVDGYTHLSTEQRRFDQNKDRFLMDRGVLVIRITNQQIRENLSECLAQIEQTIRRLDGMDSKGLMNDEWKKKLPKIHSNQESSHKKPKTIEEYFLSLEEKS
jgi:very-short-patch-repair endonuclease